MMIAATTSFADGSALNRGQQGFDAVGNGVRR